MEKIVKLKKKADKANRELSGAFIIFRDDCEYRQMEFHGRDEWYKCTHKDYFFSEYTDITPCTVSECPVIRK